MARPPVLNRGVLVERKSTFQLRLGLLNSIITCALLVCFGLGCGRTVNDVLKEAQSGSPEDVQAAISVLGSLLGQKERSKIDFDEGDRAAIEFLRNVGLESSMRSHRALAIAALGELQSVDATDIFLKTLDDELWLARLNSVRALRLHAREEFVPPLRNRLESETEVDVRIEIVKALAAIGNDEAIEALRDVYRSRTSMPKDEDIHALRSLRQLTGEMDPELGEHQGTSDLPESLKETSSPVESTKNDGDRS